MKASIKAKLAKQSKAWAAADAGAGGGSGCDLEDGRYVAAITAMELTETTNGDLQLSTTYEVSEGDSAGTSATAREMLKSEINLSYLKKKLKLFGYDPDELNLAEDLEGCLEQIVASSPAVRIQVKTSGEFTNIYVNKVLSMDEPAEEEGEVDEVDEDDEEVEEEESDDESDEEDGTTDEQVIEKGDSVMYTPPKAKKAVECLVLSVDLKRGIAKLKDYGMVKLELLELVAVDDSDEEDADEEEEEAEDETEEMVALEKGSQVSFKHGGKPATGKVLSVDDDAQTAKCKIDKLGKIVIIAFDDLDVVE